MNLSMPQIQDFLPKLLIFPEDEPVPIVALFNPDKLSFQKSTGWTTVPEPDKDTAKKTFTHGQPATLKVDLLFDTYDLGIDVRLFTQKIYHLTTIQNHGELHRPPVCTLFWGLFDFDGFHWVVTQLEQTFTLFHATGLPARATLQCSFEQYQPESVADRLLSLHSADLEKTCNVRRGDTLDAIAARFYKDPALWRPIAEANDLDDPRRLEPGLTLTIPKLTEPRPRES